MRAQSSYSIRDSLEEDVVSIALIYAHWVRHGLASFELEAPSPAELAQRRHAVLADGFPYLVATDRAGSVCGYAYASWYRTRPGYRFTCEDSVYVAPAAAGRGIGGALLDALIGRATALGMRLMVAVIGDSSNAPSIGLHQRRGFKEVGTFSSIGWKHRRWVDTVLMARQLGEGDSTPPITDEGSASEAEP